MEAPPATDVLQQSSVQEEPPTKRSRTSTAARAVVGWIRNDIRLRDSPVLEAVAEQARQGGLPSILVYIFDPRFYEASEYGRVTDPELQKSIATRRAPGFSSRKCNCRRARFYLNALRDLRRGLRELGTELWLLQGKPEEVFPGLAAQYGGLDVICLREPVSPEWTDVEDATAAALAASGGSLTRLWGAMSLYHEEDLPFKPSETPGSYAGLGYALGWDDIWLNGKRAEGAAPIRRPIPAPAGAWPQPHAQAPQGAWEQSVFDDDRQALARLGFSAEEVSAALSVPHGGPEDGRAGETAAWERFRAWMAEEPDSEQAGFKDWDLPCSGTQNSADGADPFQWKNLSRPNGWLQLSKYLACGCITPREIYHALADAKHWGLPGVTHRLMWREWHRLNAIKYGRRLFWLQGPGKQNTVWKNDPEAAERWKAGSTGLPYIDACMRELAQTGWLAYKGRKTCAAFLAMDLWLDWRLGAFHFEEVLLDYDVAMNYGNWVTCVRVDKNYWGESWRSATHEDFKLKISAEAANDPEGAYVRRWVPELKDVPAKYLHVPWLMSAEQMEAAKCVVGKDYPEPLLPREKLNFFPEDYQGPEAGSDECWSEQRTDIEAGKDLKAGEPEAQVGKAAEIPQDAPAMA